MRLTDRASNERLPKTKKKKVCCSPPHIQIALMDNQIAVIEATPEQTAPLTYEEVARCAYAMWEARGRLDGFAEQDWLEAEQHLRSMRSQGLQALQTKSQAA